MLRFIEVLKYFGERTLFKDVSFCIGRGERVGLVGCNGSGKSTLLQIAAGLSEPDSGKVNVPERWRTAYLAQNVIAEDLCSGGERQRNRLFAFMRDDADIWLLDEPTNNLDAEATAWFERELSKKACACLIVSHDRRFLDNTVTRIIELDPLTQLCMEFGGNYSFYREKIASEERRQWRQYAQQQEKIRQLEADIRQTKQQAVKVEKSTQDDFIRGRAKKVAAKAKAREGRLMRMMSAEHKVEKPKASERIRLEMPESSFRNKLVLAARDVSFVVDQQTILDGVNVQLFGGQHVLVSGRNGSGKSTLLELIAGNYSPSSGSLVTSSVARIAYIPQQQEYLPPGERLIDWFEGQLKTFDVCPSDHAGIRTYLHRFLFSRDDVFKTFGQLSCGERMRLQLAVVIADNPDLLILDEPTNHLDVSAIESTEQALAEFNGTVIAVSHDRSFQDALQPDMIWHVEDGTVIVASPTNSPHRPHTIPTTRR